jgi:hypothetical protein
MESGSFGWTAAIDWGANAQGCDWSAAGTGEANTLHRLTHTIREGCLVKIKDKSENELKGTSTRFIRDNLHADMDGAVRLVVTKKEKTDFEGAVREIATNRRRADEEAQVYVVWQVGQDDTWAEVARRCGFAYDREHTVPGQPGGDGGKGTAGKGEGKGAELGKGEMSGGRWKEDEGGKEQTQEPGLQHEAVNGHSAASMAAGQKVGLAVALPDKVLQVWVGQTRDVLRLVDAFHPRSFGTDPDLPPPRLCTQDWFLLQRHFPVLETATTFRTPGIKRHVHPDTNCPDLGVMILSRDEPPRQDLGVVERRLRAKARRQQARPVTPPVAEEGKEGAGGNAARGRSPYVRQSRGAANSSISPERCMRSTRSPSPTKHREASSSSSVAASGGGYQRGSGGKDGADGAGGADGSYNERSLPGGQRAGRRPRPRPGPGTGTGGEDGRRPSPPAAPTSPSSTPPLASLPPVSPSSPLDPAPPPREEWRDTGEVAPLKNKQRTQAILRIEKTLIQMRHGITDDIKADSAERLAQFCTTLELESIAVECQAIVGLRELLQVDNERCRIVSAMFLLRLTAIRHDEWNTRGQVGGKGEGLASLVRLLSSAGGVRRSLSSLGSGSGSIGGSVGSRGGSVDSRRSSRRSGLRERSVQLAFSANERRWQARRRGVVALVVGNVVSLDDKYRNQAIEEGAVELLCKMIIGKEDAPSTETFEEKLPAVRALHQLADGDGCEVEIMKGFAANLAPALLALLQEEQAKQARFEDEQDEYDDYEGGGEGEGEGDGVSGVGRAPPCFLPSAASVGADNVSTQSPAVEVVELLWRLAAMPGFRNLIVKHGGVGLLCSSTWSSNVPPDAPLVPRSALPAPRRPRRRKRPPAQRSPPQRAQTAAADLGGGGAGVGRGRAVQWKRNNRLIEDLSFILGSRSEVIRVSTPPTQDWHLRHTLRNKLSRTLPSRQRPPKAATARASMASSGGGGDMSSQGSLIQSPIQMRELGGGAGGRSPAKQLSPLSRTAPVAGHLDGGWEGGRRGEGSAKRIPPGTAPAHSNVFARSGFDDTSSSIRAPTRTGKSRGSTRRGVSEKRDVGLDSIEWDMAGHEGIGRPSKESIEWAHSIVAAQTHFMRLGIERVRPATTMSFNVK